MQILGTVHTCVHIIVHNCRTQYSTDGSNYFPY